MIILALFNYPCVRFLQILYSFLLLIRYPSKIHFYTREYLMRNFDFFIMERPIITTIFSIMFYNILIKIIW